MIYIYMYDIYLYVYVLVPKTPHINSTFVDDDCPRKRPDAQMTLASLACDRPTRKRGSVLALDL